MAIRSVQAASIAAGLIVLATGRSSSPEEGHFEIPQVETAYPVMASHAPDRAVPSAGLLGRLPLAFIRNAGQWETAARYVSRRGGLITRIEPGALLLQVEGREGEGVTRGAVVRLEFEAAAAACPIEGERQLPGRHNFFHGNDPAAWRTEVPAFASVVYRGLYPGIDLRLREGEGRILEYDLLVAAEADLDQFTVRCAGMEDLHLDVEGRLVIETAIGELRMLPPRSWEVGQDGSRIPIDCRYCLLGPERFGFAAPGRTPDLDLVVDPGLIFSTYLGGAGGDNASAVAVDANGITTVAGGTAGLAFPTTPGAYDRYHNGGSTGGEESDVFVTRLDPSGASLIYSTYLGGTGDEPCSFMPRVAVDPTGAATVTGSTSSTDFPTIPGSYATSYGGGGMDGFVTKLSTTGSSLLYSTYLGGPGWDYLRAVAVDATGVATVVGHTDSVFPVTLGAFQGTLAGGWDAVVTRLTPAGDALVYSTYLGGSATQEAALGVALGADGSVTLVGETRLQVGQVNHDFPKTPGSFGPTFNGTAGGGNGFVTRISPAGDALLYSGILGGSLGQGQGDCCSEVAVDSSGAATVTGWTGRPDFPTTTGAYDTTHGGGVDAFVTRIAPLGDSLIFSTFLGGADDDWGHALALEPSGAVVVTGFTKSVGFPITLGAVDPIKDGQEVFISKLSPHGDRVWYSTFLGGAGQDEGNGIVLDERSVATVVGKTPIQATFPTTPGAFDTTWNGSRDAFVARLDLLPTGAATYGISTSGGSGFLPIGVTSMPQVGNLVFSLTCANASPGMPGVLGISDAPQFPAQIVHGAQVWIDLASPLLFHLQPTADARGATEVLLPIPADPTLANLQAFAQFAWPDPCAPGGMTTSNALALTIQP